MQLAAFAISLVNVPQALLTSTPLPFSKDAVHAASASPGKGGVVKAGTGQATAGTGTQLVCVGSGWYPSSQVQDVVPVELAGQDDVELEF